MQTTRIILLRGVMPTGKNKVPMAPLRAALERAGLQNVQTYIQSGNVIASSALPQARLEQLVHDVIAAEFGGDITVLARSTSYVHQVLQHPALLDDGAAERYVTLLSGKPDSRLVQDFLTEDFSPDGVEVADDVVYIRCATSYKALKANTQYIERKLKVAATTRVHRTLRKLASLSSEARHSSWTLPRSRTP